MTNIMPTPKQSGIDLSVIMNGKTTGALEDHDYFMKSQNNHDKSFGMQDQDEISS